MGSDNADNKSVDLSYLDQEDREQLDPLDFNGTQMGNVKRVQIRKVKFSRFNDDKVIFHDTHGKFEVELSQLKSETDREKLKSELEWGDDLYICVIVLEFAEAKSTYVVDISENESKIRKLVNRIKQIQTKYDQEVPFEFIGDGMHVNFGTEYKYRNYLPKSLETTLPRISTNGKKMLYVMILIYLCLMSTPIFFETRATIIAISIITIATGFVGTGQKINSETHIGTRTDIPHMYVSKYKEEQESRVVLADVIERDECVILHSSSIESSWTFPKNDFGDLKGIGGKVVEQSPKNGSKVILRVSKSGDLSRGIRSDAGDYIIEGFDNRLEWMI